MAFPRRRCDGAIHRNPCEVNSPSLTRLAIDVNPLCGLIARNGATDIGAVTSCVIRSTVLIRCLEPHACYPRGNATNIRREARKWFVYVLEIEKMAPSRRFPGPARSSGWLTIRHQEDRK